MERPVRETAHTAPLPNRRGPRWGRLRLRGAQVPWESSTTSRTPFTRAPRHRSGVGRVALFAGPARSQARASTLVLLVARPRLVDLTRREFGRPCPRPFQTGAWTL